MKKFLRIGIDGWALRTGGGVRRYLASLLPALRAAGPDVSWTVYGGGPRDPAVPEGVAWRGPSGYRESAWGWAAARLAREEIGLPALLAADGADLLYAPKGVVPLRPLPFPVVATVHDCLPISQPATETLAARLYWRARLAGVAAHAREVIAVSRYSREAFLAAADFPPERVTVVPNGCAARFRPQPTERVARACAAHGLVGPYVMTAATFQPRKNHAALLAAFARLRREGYPGTLVLAGRRGWGDAWRRARGLADALGIGESVRWLGYVSDDDLPALYTGADLFIYPSRSEGFGLPPLEAAACGAPVVASRAGGLLEILGEAALWIDPESPAEIAWAAQRVLADAALRRRLAAAGPLLAARFTWEEAAHRTLAVLRRAAG